MRTEDVVHLVGVDFFMTREEIEEMHLMHLQCVETYYYTLTTPKGNLIRIPLLRGIIYPARVRRGSWLIEFNKGEVIYIDTSCGHSKEEIDLFHKNFRAIPTYY